MKEHHMDSINKLSQTLGGLPLEYLILFVALAAIGLAAFSIHSICSIVTRRERRHGP
jgi:hypothetical protein